MLGVVPAWEPVSARGGAAAGGSAVRLHYDGLDRADVEGRAGAYGLQPVRWPDPFPADSGWAMLVAAYARHIGRVVAFSLAAFRQAFAGGRDLGRRDNVLIAAAACELHPAAVIKGAGLTSTRRRLEEATATAIAAGVRQVPAVRVGRDVFHGDRALERAAAALRREQAA